MNPIYLSKKAEDGVALLRADLEKLHEANREVIPERHLRILDRVQEFSLVILTVLISVSIIYVVWMILSTDGMYIMTRLSTIIADFMRLAKVVA
jgi:hypothetical protein